MQTLLLATAMMIGGFAQAQVPAKAAAIETSCEVGYGKSTDGGRGDDLAVKQFTVGKEAVAIKIKGYTVRVEQEEICPVNFFGGPLPDCTEPLLLNIQVEKGPLQTYTQMDISGGWTSIANGAESIQVRCFPKN